MRPGMGDDGGLEVTHRGGHVLLATLLEHKGHGGPVAVMRR